MTSSPSSLTCQMCQDVTPLGLDVTFWGFLCAKIKLLCKGEILRGTAPLFCGLP
jgi:hypothetical protein